MPEDEIRDDQIREPGDDQEAPDSTESDSPAEGEGSENVNLDEISGREVLERLGFKSFEAAEKSKKHAAKKISEQGELNARLVERLEALESSFPRQHQTVQSEPEEEDPFGDEDLFGFDEKKALRKLGPYIEQMADEKAKQAVKVDKVQTAFADIMANDPDWNQHTAMLMRAEWEANPTLANHPKYQANPGLLVRTIWERAKSKRGVEAQESGTRAAEDLIRQLDAAGYDTSILKKKDGNGSRAASPTPGVRSVPKGKVTEDVERMKKAWEKGDAKGYLDAMFDTAKHG